jgi:hypothetical protein
MIRFQDRVYTHSKKGLLVWEPSWETFRPVESVVWNPIHNQIEPFFGVYTHDIFDVDYGFGTPDMHEFCIQFTDEHAHHVGGASKIGLNDFWRWLDKPLSWIGDRSIVLHPCSSSVDRKLYLKAQNLKAGTCKRAPRNLKGTRKISKHQ